MTGTATDPFRWWHADGWLAPEIADVLYQQNEWVATFLDYVDAHLASFSISTVNLDTRRESLVVTGISHPGVLRLARATYRDLLLFHPGLHPDVEALMNEAVHAAATECARRNFSGGVQLLAGGRSLLVEDPSILLHPSVVAGLSNLGLSGLPPLGVSGIVEVRSRHATYLLGARRSNLVAVNPGCLGPPVDGGLLVSSFLDPSETLRHEIDEELPWARDGWQPVGTLLPPARPTSVAGSPTLRCGVNIVFRTVTQQEPEEALATTLKHFETDALMLIEASPSDGSNGGLRVLAHGDTGRIEPAEIPPLSEVLAAMLARRHVIPISEGDELDADLSQTRRKVNVAPVEPLTLEDAWAEDLIERHSRLRRVLDPGNLSDLAESRADPSYDNLGPVFDAVREFEFVRRTNQIKAADDARLFEALVYRIGRYFFVNNESHALAAHALMMPKDTRLLSKGKELNPIGTIYTERLKRAVAKAELEDPSGVWRNAVTEALGSLNENEAAQEYAEVARRARLLCFCAALWSLEAKRSPAAATLALDDLYRHSLSGEVIALFFRARALLVSSVLSAAQAQLGLQFVTTALATYERNPGMHHTRAIFLLRQSALTEVESVSHDCLQESLQSVETALRWDAEFPKFYATRAKVKYRLKDRSGALTDIRAAIELARHSQSSPVVRKDVTDWESLLDAWQLAPLGYAG